MVDNPDIENLTDALLHGPYGKCVYDLDNNVMSHQVSEYPKIRPEEKSEGIPKRFHVKNKCPQYFITNFTLAYYCFL